MKFLASLLLLISFTLNAAELSVPPLTSPVVDTAQLLSSSEKKDLSDLAYEIYAGGGPQISILTIPSLEGNAIEDYSMKVAESWKLGSKEKGNGVLVLIAKNDRQMRIEVGEGIEGDLTDYDTARYTRNIFPQYFRQNEYHGALRIFMQEMAEKFNVKVDATNNDYVRRAPKRVSPISIPFIIGILILLGFVGSIFKRRPGMRGVVSGISTATLGALLGFPIAILILFFMVGLAIGLVGLGNFLSAILYSGGGYHGGGPRGGGGSWGGGGGGFSGGGSSGNW